jgi:hypothetical protein
MSVSQPNPFSVRSLYHITRAILRMIYQERKSNVRLPLQQTLFAWRHGFTRRLAVAYGIQPDNVHEFLSEYTRLSKTPRINKMFSAVLDNKVLFERLFNEYSNLVPETYFMIRGRSVQPANRRYHLRTGEDVLKLLVEKGALVVKPYGGGGGHSVNIYRWENGQLTHNEKPVDPEQFAARILRMENFIGCEFVNQHEYAAHIFPRTVNTIRILTLWDSPSEDFIIPIAIHRFGRSATFPVDNFSRGGLVARIDHETGVMSTATTVIDSQKQWFSAHPETGAPIEGVAVPGWEDMKRQVLEVARSLPFMPYIGWDVVQTPDGIKILEGNSHTGTNVYQAQIPLLTIPQMRAFYQKHGVIR